MEEKKVSWDDIEKMCDKIAEDIKKSFNPNIIVCVARGGLVPGTILSHKLKKPLGIISAEFYRDGRGSILNLDDKISSVEKIEGNILLVDDIMESGTTAKEIYSFVSEMENVNKVMFAALYRRVYAEFKPDFYTKDVGKVWVRFPWESSGAPEQFQ
jgi:hypoxanthine phosphoribosyltransferase